MDIHIKIWFANKDNERLDSFSKVTQVEKVRYLSQFGVILFFMGTFIYSSFL